jgi:beta-lactamase class A
MRLVCGNEIAMHATRRAFVSTVGFGFAGLTLGAGIRTTPGSRKAVALDAIANRVPGMLGVYARAMDGSPPFAVYNDHAVFPAASTIKMIIMVTAYRAYETGKATPETPVPINASDMVGGSEAFATVTPGTTFPMQRVVDAMIRVSDNTASNALISFFGFPTLRATIVKNHLDGSHLVRHFLDWTAIVKHNDNVTTPADMGSLLYMIERGAREGLTTCASPESCRKMIGVMLGQEDHDKIYRGLPKGAVLANKTGEITGVRNDVGIVDPEGDNPFVLAVLTRDLTDYEAGNAAIRRVAALCWHHMNG